MPNSKSSSAPRLSTALKARVNRVRLFLCDVDGILTDTSLFVGPDGETKRFNIQDGLGMRLLQKCGIPVGWVSHRPSPATTKRGKELKIDFLHQAATSKTEAVEVILKKTGFRWDQVCFMGDDIVDLGPLRRAGFAVSVPHGVAEARAAAHYVTRLEGGHGAVRETTELILRTQGKWADVLAEHDV